MKTYKVKIYLQAAKKIEELTARNLTAAGNDVAISIHSEKDSHNPGDLINLAVEADAVKFIYNPLADSLITLNIAQIVSIETIHETFND